MTSILLLVASFGIFEAELKVMPAELAGIVAESSVVVIATPGRSPMVPHIESVICQTTPFSTDTKLRFTPPLPISDRETEETFDGTGQRMVLLLHQVNSHWDLVSRHFGWIPLSGHNVTFRRFSPGFDPLKHYSGKDFLLIANDLLLPGGLAKGDDGSLSERALLTWIRNAFGRSHRIKS